MKIHILNWGMGVESTAILLLWVFFPETRPFKNWNQLIVLVAQTGDEFWQTKYLCETYILPLLRQLGVRLVQLAKHGHSLKDGYTVLSDTIEPYEILIEGDYRLSDSMLIDGWVPRVGRPHICAIHFKGEILDPGVGDIIAAIQDSMDLLALMCLFGRSQFERNYFFWLLEARDNIQIGPYLGYNAEELGRVKDSQDYGCHGASFLFPLVERGMTRVDCVELIYLLLGVVWRKSCCKFCPFQKKATAIAHYQSDSDAAVFALWVEYTALAMNPRMRLFERYGMREVCLEAGLESAIAEFERRCEAASWSVYYVRRIYRKVGKDPNKQRVDAARKVEEIVQGTRDEMIHWLKELAETRHLSVVHDSHWRCYSHVRNESEKTYPAIEGFWVASPTNIRDKCFRKTFDSDWRELCLRIAV